MNSSLIEIRANVTREQAEAVGVRLSSLHDHVACRLEFHSSVIKLFIRCALSQEKQFVRPSMRSQPRCLSTFTRLRPKPLRECNVAPFIQLMQSETRKSIILVVDDETDVLKMLAQFLRG